MSEPEMFRIRLIGGPYDGDSDTFPGLPRYLWAYQCTCDVLCEGINGVHWGDDDRKDASQPGAEEYRYSYADLEGHAYTWAPLTRDHLRRLERAISA